MASWPLPPLNPSPVYTPTTSRSWRRLDGAAFRDAVQSSLLCRPEVWPQLDIDALAQLYNDELTAILDRFIPMRTVRCRQRPSDPWFDEECRIAKRRTRQLEHAARRVESTDVAAVAAATAASTTQR